MIYWMMNQMLKNFLLEDLQTLKLLKKLKMLMKRNCKMMVTIFALKMKLLINQLGKQQKRALKGNLKRLKKEQHHKNFLNNEIKIKYQKVIMKKRLKMKLDLIQIMINKVEVEITKIQMKLKNLKFQNRLKKLKRQRIMYQSLRNLKFMKRFLLNFQKNYQINYRKINLKIFLKMIKMMI